MVATLATVAVTAWKLSSHQAAVKPQPTGTQALFPGLSGKVNDVAFVSVTTPEGSYVLEKKGEGWGATDKGGYPVDVSKVKALVVGIANLVVLEPKTKNPALFAKLELDDPQAAGAKGKQVTLKDKHQGVLADLIVGKSGQGRSFTGDASLFVRKVGGDGALEVSGNLSVETKVANLLDKQIAKLEKKRVRRVETLHPDGEKLVVERPGPEQENFDVVDLPAGQELSWPGVAGSVAGGLEWLNFDDVKPASEIDFAGSQATVTRFETFDGLLVTCTTIDKDDKVYLRLESSYDESKRQSEPVGPPPPPEDPAAPDAEPPPIEPPATALKSAEETKAEAESLTQRTSAWVYELPSYGAANLRKKLKDMLKQAPDAGSSGLESALTDPSGVLPPPVVDEHAGHDHAAGATPQDQAPPAPAPQESPAPETPPK